MKKLLLLFLILISVNVQAETCNINELKSLASTVSIKYDLVEEDNYYFNVSILNLGNDLVVQNANHLNQIIYGSDTLEPHIMPIMGTDRVVTLNYNVLPKNDICRHEIVRTISITLPKYNELSNTEICIENPTNDLCRKLINNNEIITYEDILSSVNKEKTKEEVITEEPKSNNIYYIMGSLALLTLLVGGVLLLVNKRGKKI